MRAQDIPMPFEQPREICARLVRASRELSRHDAGLYGAQATMEREAKDCFCLALFWC